MLFIVSAKHFFIINTLTYFLFPTFQRTFSPLFKSVRFQKKFKERFERSLVLRRVLLGLLVLKKRRNGLLVDADVIYILGPYIQRFKQTSQNDTAIVTGLLGFSANFHPLFNIGLGAMMDEEEAWLLEKIKDIEQKILDD